MNFKKDLRLFKYTTPQYEVQLIKKKAEYYSIYAINHSKFPAIYKKIK